MRKHFFNIVLFSFTLSIVQAQDQDYTFKYLSSEDGISQSEVYCFHEDSKGYIWFGTVDGLNRYDSYSIQTFRMSEDDPNSLANNTVYSIVEDKNGRIWIGTDDGLNVFDIKSQQMFSVPNFYSGKKVIIRTLLCEGKNLWIGTSQGLFRLTVPRRDLNEKSLQNISAKISHVDIEINGQASIYSSIFGIVNTRDGKIWLGTMEGICCFDYNTERKEHYHYFDISDELKGISEITDIVDGNDNSIWIGTSKHGLYHCLINDNAVIHYNVRNTPGFLTDKIRSLLIDQSGNLWIGTINEGINIMTPDQFKQKNPSLRIIQNNATKPGSLNSNLIRSFYVTKDGLVLIGTIGRGINIYNPHQKNFGLLRIPPLDESGRVNNFVRAIYPDKKNNIWIGLHNDGLIKYDEKMDRFTKMGLENFYTVFHICPVDDDLFWIATTSGAHLIQPKEHSIDVKASVNFSKGQDVAYNACFNIERSKSGIFWIASMSGIARVSLSGDFRVNKQVFNIESDPLLSLNNVRVLKYDSTRNVLWAGTEGGGLNEIILDENQFPEKINHYQNIPGDSLSLSSNYIRSLCTDHYGNLWLGTFEGLNQLYYSKDDGSVKFNRWKTQDGLLNNMIQSIEVDHEGYIWIGTNGGLTKYLPEKNSLQNYRISDGLQSNEFSEHASHISDNGRLYFGGINGINAFFPEQIKSTPIYPRVTITDFYLYNERVEVGKEVNHHEVLVKAINQTDTLILRPGENDIGFGFSAMFFADPNKIQYQYMLEGYDKLWIKTDASERNVNYTNLPFGKYHFKVKASNSDGVWKAEPREIFILIKTPYALRWWAILIYFVGFAFAIWYFTRYSVIRIATKEKLILENEHNLKIHELDLLRTRFFINISHDLRTPLTLITGPLARILNGIQEKSELKDQLELVNRNAKRLKYLVEQLLDIRKTETGKLKLRPEKIDVIELVKIESSHFDYALEEKNLKFSIESNEEQILTFLDRGMIGKVIFNLLSNALKYTDSGRVSVLVERATQEIARKFKPECSACEYIRIDVGDTGKGMSEEKQLRIFERFYQDSDTHGRGYGIGLSHTKDLVEAQDGFITVKSTEGKGTVFSVFIPLLEYSDSVSDTIQERRSEMNYELPDVMVNMSGQSPQKEGEFKCILIVDDNTDLRSYLRSGLDSKYNIIEAVDGKDGLDKTYKFLPDMIISDIMMPVMDGTELCKHVKSDIQTSHIPVILLTARTDYETKYKGIETGADDYVSKPFEIDYLRLRIKNIFKTREHLKNLFTKNVDLEPSAVTVTSADEKFLTRILQVIEEAIPDTEFSIESMEQALGMSHTNFYRKVKSLTGQSGKELLQNMRLKRAVQLLSENKLRISEIAYLSGFSNPKYFSKCFKEKYGVNPSDYKNNNE